MVSTTTGNFRADSAERTTERYSIAGGIGGLVFIASVVAQNALRSRLPVNDAEASKVIDYYAAHWNETRVLAVLFPIGALGLMLFLGVFLARVASIENRALAISGALAATGIAATFAMVTATDLGLAGYIHNGNADPGIVEAGWMLHNAVFGCLLVSLGIALAGLSFAAAERGFLRSWWKPLGSIGGLLLLISAATTPAMLDGSNTMVIGLIGFVVWLLFLLNSSISLLRERS